MDLQAVLISIMVLSIMQWFVYLCIAFGSKIDYEFNKSLNGSLLFTYKGRTRDYGTADQSFRDQILDEYFLIDLASSYKT